MCGISGFLSRTDIGSDEASGRQLRIMGSAIAHRGPDSSGVWMDRSAGIGLVHRRLAIVDLTAAGHQPMASSDGRYVIAFNGEIYNHLELRDELERSGRAPAWRGHSDTESLLAGFLAWGIEGTIFRCTGMFAIALWDRQERLLTLVRDRMGEKPLYYGWQGQGRDAVFLFGSELKSIQAHPAFRSEVNRDALALLMRHNYIPAPHSIFRGIHKLTPGTILTMSLGSANAQPSAYWRVADAARQGLANPFTGSTGEALDELERLAKAAVHGQMAADVPLGAFLSGGIDSSTVVALMQAQSSAKVKTFTIGFHEEGYNEAVHAKAVASHLGTDHTEMYVAPADAMALIPRLPALYDEPFSDSSQLPTFLISQLARQHVTVALSGDAGDELFGGYSRYTQAAGAWRFLRPMPSRLRTGVARSIQSVPVHTWNQLSGFAHRFIPGRKRNIGDRAHKFADMINFENSHAFYRRLISHWAAPETLVLGSTEAPNYFSSASDDPKGMSFIESMMLADSLTYLPDDILVKVDRAAMGVSLETRVPFLDHSLVEFAWRLPLSYKIRDGQGKWLLRQLLYRHVPRKLVERPKMGFGVPIDGWLRGPLRGWAENLLAESRLRDEGFFEPSMVRQKWNEHVSGQRNWQYHLWDILMFQAWLEQNRKTMAPTPELETVSC
jgi:asparagine synthase (glutamine-hydrolysing)